MEVTNTLAVHITTINIAPLRTPIIGKTMCLPFHNLTHSHILSFAISGSPFYQLKNIKDLISGHLRLKSNFITDLLTDLGSVVSQILTHFHVSNFPTF